MNQQQSNPKHLKTKSLTEGAIMLAIAVVLSYIKVMSLPQGGEICLSMLPLFMYNYRWGFNKGLLFCFAYSILILILDGAYAWGPTSMILDYIVAFSVLSISGLFNKSKYGLYVGSIVASFIRFIIHFISGITIYRIYTPTAVFNTAIANPYIYSAVYNGSFMLIDTIICIIILAILNKPLYSYLEGKDLN